MKSKKITFHVPGFIYELLKADIEKYKITQGALCNKIFKTFHDNYKEWDFESNLEKPIHFQLNPKNFSLFKKITEDKKIQSNISKYFRNLAVTYLDNKPYHRERIIYKKNLDKIFEAIENRKKISIEYKNEKRILEPYLIKTTKEELFNYVLSWCETHKEYRNYRLSNFTVNYVKNESWDNYDKSKVESFSENFDPFLSQGKIVKVKFTKKGKDLFENVIFYNRPEVIEKKDKIYTLQCSLEKAKAYFASFFDEVEILEPQKIRNYFGKKYSKLSEIYQE